MRTDTLTADYHSSFTANVPAQEAFADICRVDHWWTTNFRGRAEQPNDVFTVTFGDTFVTIRIGEVIPGKKIVWEVTDCHLPWLKNKTEWTGTKIVWEVSAAGSEGASATASKGASGPTRVDMTHIGLVPGIECYETCEKGWNFHFKESLYKLMTEKKGFPERKR